MNQGIAVITGASSGIGAIYADRLARRGFDLLLAARDHARLEGLAARLRRDAGVEIEVVRADLTCRSDTLGLEERLRRDDRITMLVNNAGISGGGPLQTAHPDMLEAIIDLNVVAFTRLATAAAAGFASRGSGTIINIASVTALFPERLDPVYPATKAFGIAFSQALAAQLGPEGVRVQVVLPGATRTEIWERAGADIDALPPGMVMEVDDLVDAALSGLDLGEPVTIPSLPDTGGWTSFEDARHALLPFLSLSRPAPRYRHADGTPIGGGVG